VRKAKAPVRKAKAPVRKAKAPVRKAKAPVRKAKAPVRKAKAPVRKAKAPVRKAKAPVRKAKAPVRKAKAPVRKAKAPTRVTRKPTRAPARGKKPLAARKPQRLADLREERRKRRLAEKESRRAQKLKAEKLKAEKRLKAERLKAEQRLKAEKKLKAERILAEKRVRAERIKAEKKARIDRIKAEKKAKVEKLKADKQAKVEKLKADKQREAEKREAERQQATASKKAEQASREKDKAGPSSLQRPSRPGALLDRKSTPGAAKTPSGKTAPPPKGGSGAPPRRESERPTTGKSQPPGRMRAPLMRAPAVVIPKEPPRPPIEERATTVEKRLQEQPPEVLREYEERLFMSWIHHDSALEGVVYTFQELQMAVDPAITVVPDSSIQPICDEIRRHKQAIDFVREQAKLKEPVSADLVKRIYLLLHPEEGDLKTVKYRKDIPQHRLYFHEYAAPDKIAYGVRQVVEWINDPETARTRGALRIAARAHYDFIRIFPFQSDSGKVARLLMNYVLMLAGFPPAIIHSTERQRYYEALKGSPLAILHMVTEALENSVASIEKFLNERATRVRSFVS